MWRHIRHRFTAQRKREVFLRGRKGREVHKPEVRDNDDDDDTDELNMYDELTSDR